VSEEGRIRTVTPDRDGYRVELDRSGYSYWVPSYRARGGRGLRAGISIRLGGIFRGGYVDVDALDWLDQYDDRYDNRYDDRGYLHGVVERVDYRYDTILLRDDRSGRRVEVDMRSIGGRRGRIDGRDLRRGDVVTLAGEWIGGRRFAAYRIDSVNTRRW
jgi:hypothetical protein